MSASSKKKPKYEYVKHTADIEFFAYGKTMSELFRNAALALFNAMADTKAVSKQTTGVRSLRINTSSYSAEDLLWRILQRSLSLSSADGLLAYRVKAMNVKRGGRWYKAGAVILCKSGSAESAQLDVKGISKYDMHINASSGLLKASVVLDV
jgi:SHS2 domain-containing protein